MGFFDELNASPIKTMPDGQRMFFPYGNWGRGYVIPTHQDHDRLQRLIRTYTIVTLAVLMGTYVVFDMWVVAAALFMTAFYCLWVPSLLGELGRSDETLTYKQVMAPYARLEGAVMLWVVLVIALAIAGFGIAMLWNNRQLAMFAVPSIAFFGVVSAVCALLVVMRKRAMRG